MAGNDKKADELDIMALLNEVHGTVAGGRGQTIEQALRAMELTHRQAALAMRQFERSGRVGRSAPEDRSGLTFEPPAASERAEAAPPAQAKPVLPAPRSERPAAPPAQRERGEEVTALWRPPSTQPVSTDAGRPVSAAPKEARSRASSESKKSAGDRVPHEHSEANTALPPPPAPVSHAEVYGGRGADYAPKEPTRTAVLPRPKK